MKFLYTKYRSAFRLLLLCTMPTQLTLAYDDAFVNGVIQLYIDSFSIKDNLRNGSTITPATALSDMLKGVLAHHIIVPPVRDGRGRYQSAKRVYDRTAAYCVTGSDFPVVAAQDIKTTDIVASGGSEPSKHLVYFATTYQGASLLSTTWGHLQAAAIISQPIVDTTRLDERKSMIKLLLKNPVLVEKIKHLLVVIRQSEDDVLAMFDEVPFINEQLAAIVAPYMGKRSAIISELNIRIVQGVLAFNIIAPFFGLIWSIYGEYSYYQAYKIPVSLISICKKYLLNRHTQLELGVQCGLSWGLGGTLVVSKIKEQYAVLKAMNNTIRAYRKIIIASKALATLLREYGADVGDLVAALEGCFGATADAKECRRLLLSNAFNNDRIFTKYAGNIHATYMYLGEPEIQQEMSRLCKAIGELDCYVALANKMSACNAQPDNHMCFAEYVTGSASPIIAMKNAWNTFVSASPVVCNDVSLGTPGDARFMIITGPNAGGKSTYMKSVFHNLVLAQTFGIAFADACTITPFGCLKTYGNITDDIAEGNSTFKQAIKRSKQMLKAVQNAATQGLFSFVLIDELFSGTSVDQIESLTHAYMKQIASIAHCVGISATHYKSVLGLECETEGLVRNYQVGAQVNEDGSFAAYTYRIEPGISPIKNAAQVAVDNGLSLFDQLGDE